MRATTISLLLVLLGGAGGHASARAEEYEETEHRLKSAGVEDAFRLEIHRSIRRGVAFLRTHQLRDGSFALNAGWTSLAGLALRHAAIPDGIQAARRSIAWLESQGRRQAIEQTYNAGLTAMLLQADGQAGDLQRALHGALALGPLRDGAGYWDYASRGGLPVPNLSTAQFGCLGLWAGERAGEPVATRTWHRHLLALLDAQEESGSWGYRLAGTADRPDRDGYATGTFMGLANLLLAEQALEEALQADGTLWIRVRLARARARAALRRHGRWALAFPPRRGPLGDFHYYRLYALEKACIFLGQEEIGGAAWYRRGARWLIDHQERDGGWAAVTAPPPPQGNEVVVLRQPIQTAFALLFLLRASESYRPITPRPVGGGPVTTPGDALPPPGGGRADASPAVLPLPVAERMLDDLTAALRADGATSVDALRKALDFMRRTLAAYRPDGAPLSAPHDTWCRRVETLLLDAATGFEAHADDPRAQLVALEALEMLASASARAGAQLLGRVRAAGLGRSLPTPLRVAWVGAAFEALRRLDPPGLGAYLLQEGLSPRPEDWPQTAAALTALDGLTFSAGEARHAAAKTALTRLEPLFTRPAAATLPTADLVFDLSLFVQGLGGRRAQADPPPLPGLDAEAAYRALRRWFATYDRAHARIWRD